MNITKYLYIFSLFISISCKKEKNASIYSTIEEEQNPIELGENVFNSHGMCYSCHKIDKKIIGPSLVEIATIYKNKNGNIISFLLEKSKPIVAPEQYETMKTNFAITKNLPQKELEALQAYIMQFAN